MTAPFKTTTNYPNDRRRPHLFIFITVPITPSYNKGIFTPSLVCHQLFTPRWSRHTITSSIMVTTFQHQPHANNSSITINDHYISNSTSLSSALWPSLTRINPLHRQPNIGYLFSTKTNQLPILTKKNNAWPIAPSTTIGRLPTPKSHATVTLFRFSFLFLPPLILFSHKLVPQPLTYLPPFHNNRHP